MAGGYGGGGEGRLRQELAGEVGSTSRVGLEVSWGLCLDALGKS